MGREGACLGCYRPQIFSVLFPQVWGPEILFFTISVHLFWLRQILVTLRGAENIASILTICVILLLVVSFCIAEILKRLRQRDS